MHLKTYSRYDAPILREKRLKFTTVNYSQLTDVK